MIMLLGPFPDSESGKPPCFSTLDETTVDQRIKGSVNDPRDLRAATRVQGRPWSVPWLQGLRREYIPLVAYKVSLGLIPD